MGLPGPGQLSSVSWDFVLASPWCCHKALCQSCDGSVDLQVTACCWQGTALPGAFHQEPETPASLEVELGGDVVVNKLGMLIGTS